MAVGRHASTTQPSLNNGTIGLSNGTFVWPFRLMTLNALGLLGQAIAVNTVPLPKVAVAQIHYH